MNNEQQNPNVQTTNQQSQQSTTQDTAGNQNQFRPAYETIFCNTCGSKIAKSAIQCPHCGAPVYQNQQQQQQQPQQIVINNTNTNANANMNINGAVRGINPKNKWTAFLLCLFLGYFGAHKFYEGKIALGIVYIFTFGLFGIGWIIDLIALLFKPNPYFV